MEEDQTEDLANALQDLQGQRSSWKLLQESPGWKKLIQYSEAQLRHRMDTIILNESIGERELSYARGECAGIKLFAAIPTTEIDRLTAEIEVIAAKLEETE